MKRNLFIIRKEGIFHEKESFHNKKRRNHKEESYG